MMRKNLTANSSPRELITRRNVLQLGGQGLLGLSLPQFLQAQALQAALPTGQRTEQRIRACILIFYYGGPSHLDTFDMKPNAPVEIRGEFKSIPTSLPGLRISEYLPHTSRIMHKIALIRSMNHGMRFHDSASYQTLTGRVSLAGDTENFGERADSFPCFGSTLSHVRRNERILVPHCSLPYVMNNNKANPGQTPGFLGKTFQSLLVQGDPDTLTYSAGLPQLREGMSRQRLSQREEFRKTVDRLGLFPEVAPSMNVYYERAFDLLGSDTVRDALDVQKEPAATRERYGYGPAGQPYDDDSKSMANVETAIGRNMRGLNLLVARRLVEAGVPFVNVYDYKQQGKNWDTHDKNFSRHKDHLLPPADQAFTALVEDLEERGLLDTTLVVALGEFGRTPRINGKAGRDHWPDCYTVVLAGGGVKGGYIHGASDKLGAYPESDPVTPGDLGATIFNYFGVDPATVIHDPTGRPHRIAEGKPVHELFA